MLELVRYTLTLKENIKNGSFNNINHERNKESFFNWLKNNNLINYDEKIVIINYLFEIESTCMNEYYENLHKLQKLDILHNGN